MISGVFQLRNSIYLHFLYAIFNSPAEHAKNVSSWLKQKSVQLVLKGGVFLAAKGKGV